MISGAEDMEYATVKDIKDMMEVLISGGYGDYVVTCNNEYTLSMTGDSADLDHEDKTADLGGYN